MSKESMWNLTAEQWSAVLDSNADSNEVAARLRRLGSFVPWSQLLVDETRDCTTSVDLGCGRGEHSAVLGRAGLETTLVDWSDGNLLFCRQMYDALDLHGQFVRADITKPLPLATASVDVVFSCGVFEYFTAAEIDRIMAEAFRVARKRVIIMVPNAWALGYRVGKWWLERTGRWEWGGEVPAYSLRQPFVRAGAAAIREFSVAAQHSVDFLAPLPAGERMVRFLTSTLRLTRHSQPSRFKQGYLLVTVGEK